MRLPMSLLPTLNLSRLNYIILSQLPVKQEITTQLRRVHPPAPNNFWAISVVAVLIYVRAHVNVPFHRIAMLHQSLLDKIAPVRHRFIHPTTVVKQFESFVDFLLSTDHLRPYLSERRLLDTSTTRNSSPHLSLLIFLLLLLSLFPLAFASSPQITTINRDLILLDDFPFNASSITFLSSRSSGWHAGCCIHSKKALISTCNTSLNFPINDTRHYQLSEVPYDTDFLNNETLFCQRYDAFRHLSLHHLVLFTYSIVIIGIILNTFVFLVLMCGSLRRSSSFILFLALTVFDLMSLASSLFAQLFRTVMTYLKTSAPFCKMFGIFFLYFRQCSSNTLLLIAIERCIVIKYPFCRHMFDRLRLPLLGMIMAIFVAPIPFDFLFYTSGTLHCEAFDTIQADRYQIFRGFFTVFSYAIVPFVGISLSNLLIIIELKKSKQRFMSKDENGEIRRFSSK